MRVAIYSRVSTQDQETENQLRLLREYASRLGHEVAAEFIDVASGARSDRAELQKMFLAASRKEFDLLLFYALDRLSREGVPETIQYLQRLDAYGIAYRSYTEMYLDSLGPFKDVMLAILAYIAKQEKVRISERTKAGLQRAVAQGKVLGRPRALSTAQVAEAKKMHHDQKMNWSQIARHFKVSGPTVRDLVTERNQP